MIPELIAIDPGNCTGWATFHATTGLLHYAGVTDVVSGSFTGYYTNLVIEIPQVYRTAQSKGDPNDLIKVAVQAGQWIERFRACEVKRVLPNEWKGQVPKSVHNKRVLACLTPEELERIAKLPESKAHNMIDAIGLGLWHFGRLRR